MLMASVPPVFAFLSTGNESLTTQSPAAILMSSQKFLLTMADWLPKNLSTVTKAWAGASTALVKKISLERDFSGNASSPFAIIELASDLATKAASAVLLSAIPNGQAMSASNSFWLVYADASLFRLTQTERLAWNGQMIGETCPAPATPEQYCAKPTPLKTQVSTQLLGNADVRMGFLVEPYLKSGSVGVVIGLLSPSAPYRGVQGAKTFIRPGQSYAFLKSAMTVEVDLGSAGIVKMSKANGQYSGYPVYPVVEIDTPDAVLLYEAGALAEIDCTAVVLSNYFVLTPASCLQGRTIARAVFMGRSLDVAKVIVHPYFDAFASESAYDFALLELKQKNSYSQKRATLDSFGKYANGTKLVRMELGGSQTVGYVQMLSSDKCNASTALDLPSNRTSLAGPDRLCVAEASSDQAKPVKPAALVYSDGSSFVFVGFQLHPSQSNRFISVLNALNFIRGYTYDTGGTKGQDGDAIAIPVAKRYTVGLRITQNGHNFCGGSLVASTYVLTAAHCVADGLVSWVTIGSDGTFYETIRVVRNSIVIHPQFGNPYMNSNDAAIFQIESSPIARAVTLDNSMDYAGRPLASVFSYDDVPGTNMVRIVSLPVWSRKECESKYAAVDSSTLCAGGQAGVDACQGDSGSPLTLTDSSGKDQQIGIVSSGFRCGQAGVPGFYTRTSSIVDFVERNVVKASWAKPLASHVTDDNVSPATAAPPTQATTVEPARSPAASGGTRSNGDSGSSTHASKLPSLVASGSQSNPVDARSLDGVSPILQSKVVDKLVNGDSTSDSSIDLFKGLKDKLASPDNQVTVYSSGGMEGLFRVIEAHNALPLNQRADRFATAQKERPTPNASEALSQVCSV